MAPRSSQRQASTRRSALRPTQEDGAAPTQEKARKSRRLARRVGEPGPSGWKHAEGEGESGTEMDLVPPSDVEEYEEWSRMKGSWKGRSRQRRRGSIDGSQSSMEVDNLENSSLRYAFARNVGAVQSRGSKTPSRRLSSEFDEPSIATSPTIPLASSQLRSPLTDSILPHRSHAYVRVYEQETDVDSEDSHTSLGERGQARRWKALFSPGASIRSLSFSPTASPLSNRSRRSGPTSDHDLLADREVDIGSYGLISEAALPVKEQREEAGILEEVHEAETTNRWGSMVSRMELRDDGDGGEVLPDEYEPPPIPSTKGRAAVLREKLEDSCSSPEGRPGSDTAVLHLSTEVLDAGPTSRSQSKPLVSPPKKRSRPFDSSTLPLALHGDRASSPVLASTPTVQATSLDMDEDTPTVKPSAPSTPPAQHNGPAHSIAHSPLFKQSSIPTEEILLTPVLSLPSTPLRHTPVRSIVFDEQPDSPLVEAQVGPHNISKEIVLSPQSGDGGVDYPQADHMAGNSSPMTTPRPQPADNAARLLPGSPAMSNRSDVEMDRVTPTPSIQRIQQMPVRLSPSPPPQPSLPPADPALERFRTSRTFRTRTKLQLQPYTKERQIYEEALRRGGLKKGKRAIARERDISPSEEDNEPEGEDRSTSEAEIDPERIVIGNTQEFVHRKKKELVDADYDEYFLQYGSTPQDDDAETQRRLQKIARIRCRAVKEARIRRKEAERSKREFEKLLKNGPGGDPDLAMSDDSLTPPPSPPRKLVQPPIRSTPGRAKTYGKKDRGRASVTHKAPTQKAQTGRHAAPTSSPKSTRHDYALSAAANNHRSATDRPISHLTSPAQNSPAPIASPADNHEAPGPLHDEGTANGDFAMDMDVVPGDGQEFGSMAEEESFFIDDLPAKTRHARPSRPDQSSSESSSEESAERKDARRKIAGRMMPAFMLKRLEREAAEKERRKQEKIRRENRRSASPLRPGQAVVRRGAANLEGGDLLGFVQSDGESSESVVAVDRSRSGTPLPLRQRQLTVISDDSDNASSSSEAQEGHTTAKSLARLYEGDFETIVNGARPLLRRLASASKRKHRKANGVTGKKKQRPALGLVKSVNGVPAHKHRTPVKRPKSLYQAQLDFPVEDKRSPATIKSTSAKKRKYQARKADHTRHRRATERPAIRLDDHIIFSKADFAFEESQDDARSVSVTSQPRKSKKTPLRSSISRPGPPSAAGSVGRVEQIDHVDAGIGKARSWANFDKFPIDFGIAPLPSGLYCKPDSYIGDGALQRTVELLMERPIPQSLVEPVSTYGVELRDDMAPAAISSVLAILFDGIKADTLAYVNNISPDPPSTRALAFLAGYIASRRGQSDGDLSSLQSTCAQAVNMLSQQLDRIVLNGKPSPSVRHTLISLRIALLDLACKIVDTSLETAASSVVSVCGIGLLEQLLAFGFDRAIRPLKKILKGESKSPEVDNELTMAWITVRHVLDAWAEGTARTAEGFLPCLEKAIEEHYPSEETGPIASERIWFLIFGLCALSQFEVDGHISAVFNPEPRWQLVRRAVGLIKISHNEETEERAHIEQLRGRDRYIKTMIARCVRLSAIWKWSFDRESFSVATKDLGVIFKDRQHRNLPTEPPVDYPDFITRFDMSLTAAEDTTQETAFELYLRLVCVAASDLIGLAMSLSEAQKAEKDVQRLIMSIIPVSPVKFGRILPPTSRQLGQLINRYSTMIAACYFSPSLLTWLLANSRKWIAFSSADFESRQIVIRGLMYLAVACRHHDSAAGLSKVVESLAEILGVLQNELDGIGKPSRPAQAPSKIEIERTMVLVVVCFRHIIQHHSFVPETQLRPVYPDACLLHESWTGRIFGLDLSSDTKCGMEVVSTIQTFLDARAAALPALAKQRRETRGQIVESQDEYSFGIDFSAVDLAALGGEAAVDDPVARQDERFAEIIDTVISPSIYRLLSDMLPLFPDETISEAARAERQVFISRITKCWSDCAAVLVVEQNSTNGWSKYIGPFGAESWQRFRDERESLQVGLQFMITVATIDPGCLTASTDSIDNDIENTFLDLFFQCIMTDRLTVEHKFISAFFAIPHALDIPLFAEVTLLPRIKDGFDRTRFMEERSAILEAVFTAIPSILRSDDSDKKLKSRIYRYINLLVSAMINNEKSISSHRVIHKESYHAFTTSIASSIIRFAGEYINTTNVPGLKEFV